LTEQLVHQLGYVGISLILVLGGLGLPIPEEVPIILAAVLSRHGRMWWPFAVSACMAGVLIGDFVVYFLGYFYGEKVLSLRLTRRLLTRPREAQIKGYFHRHGFKILVLGRFAPGFRTAAYLTAGILQLPPIKLLLTDFVAASLSTSIMFGLGFLFANQIQGGIHEFQRWLVIVLGLCLISWLLHRYIKARRRSGQPVGPPVQLEDEIFPPLVAEAVKTSGILESGNADEEPPGPAEIPEPAPENAADRKRTSQNHAGEEVDRPAPTTIPGGVETTGRFPDDTTGLSVGKSC
jgi:membrane protein DedA with SNARE-associated domain